MVDETGKPSLDLPSDAEILCGHYLIEIEKSVNLESFRRINDEIL